MATRSVSRQRVENRFIVPDGIIGSGCKITPKNRHKLSIMLHRVSQIEQRIHFDTLCNKIGSYSDLKQNCYLLFLREKRGVLDWLLSTHTH